MANRDKPAFVVRAPDPNNKGRWLTLGAAWEKSLSDGQIAYSVKLNTMPVGHWDGALMLLPPLPNGDDTEAPK